MTNAARFTAWMLVAGCLAGCSKDKAGGSSDNPNINWRKVTITAALKKSVVEVGRYERAIPLKLIEPSAARRDTPLATWNSWQSMSVSGKDDNDLKTYADYFVDGPAFLARLKSPAAKFFDDARKADERPQALGLIKTGSYSVVVYGVRHQSQYRAAVMISRDGKYYIDDNAKLSNPVLRELTADGYSVIKERPATATAPSSR
jgi:hypothetical protein